MSRRVAIVDLETTGLDPVAHELWEAGLIFRADDEHEREEHLFRVEPDLAKADPGALRVNRYYERTRLMKHRDTLAHDIARTPANRVAYWSHPAALAVHLARLLDDVTLLCSVPTFDTAFLAAFLRAHGQAPTWNHRVRDFASAAWGFLTGRPDAATPVIAIGLEPAPPLVPSLDAGTADFAMALGVDRTAYDLHTALGDCRLVDAGLDVIEGVKPR